MCWEQFYGFVMSEFWYWKYFNIPSLPPFLQLSPIQGRSGWGKYRTLQRVFLPACQALSESWKEAENFLVPAGCPDINPELCSVQDNQIFTLCQTSRYQLYVGYVDNPLWVPGVGGFGRISEQVAITNTTQASYIHLYLYFRIHLLDRCDLTSLFLNF